MVNSQKSDKKEFQLEDHPRSAIKEIPGMYAKLDDFVCRAENIIRNLPEKFFNPKEEIIYFGNMDRTDLRSLIKKDPSVMVIALTRVCGLSDREFLRTFGLKNVYGLRKSDWTGGEDEHLFLESILGLLPNKMYLETFLYTFYKMWEEHQKRHYRAKFEKDVREFFRSHGYECEKITKPTEVNGAIPPKEPHVVMQVRTGVRKDLVKRAKEFSSEAREAQKFPGAKFLVIFKIPPHQLTQKKEIRKTIRRHEPEEVTYDAIVFQDELEDVLELLDEWGVPKVE